MLTLAINLSPLALYFISLFWEKTIQLGAAHLLQTIDLECSVRDFHTATCCLGPLVSERGMLPYACNLAADLKMELWREIQMSSALLSV